jgi:hypothetical protein
MKTHLNNSSATQHRQGLNRRNFLRGLGACIALPAMESFLPVRALAADSVAAAAGGMATTATGAPLRTAFLYFPNGAIPGAWWPTGEGKDYVLNRTMQPLAGFKDKIQVLGGLTDLPAEPGADGGGDHARANGTFLTGVRIKKTSGNDFHAGVSADQVIAQQMGMVTPFRSLELSSDTDRRVGDCDKDYACVYQHNFAWSTPTTPLTPEVNPRQLFERLFGEGSREQRAANLALRQKQQRSILDFVMDASGDLQGKLSKRDEQKLDEYLTGVREIEQRIQAVEHANASRPQPAVDAPSGIPESFSEHMRMMYDMLHLAFQTDSTRIATLMLAHDGDDHDFREIGIPDGHHTISHHKNDPGLIEKVTQIDVWYAQQLAYFLQKMENTKDIDGNSMLHNSMIVYGGGNADGNRHTHVNLPVILAGAGGGKLNPGRYNQYNSEPITNLYLSMMDAMGVQSVERFGNSTGRLGV